MQLRTEQLEGHLAKALAPLYVVHGDEPLLAIEATDAIRAAARRRDYTERVVFQADRHFDWSELVYAGASLSLFATTKIVELRLATGKPGVQGAEAIVRYCEKLNPETLTVVLLPRLDRASKSSAWFGALSKEGVVIDVYPLERARLPAWIGERLKRQGQRAGNDVLEHLADRVEGNLLAANQEVLKLALLGSVGELTLDDVRDAVANVARYDAYDASAALLGGELVRYVRVIDGLRGEGEAPNLVLWALSEDLRALERLQQAAHGGKSLDALMRENRIWGPRQQTMKASMRRHSPATVAGAIARCALIDRAIKGVAQAEPWDEFIKLGLQLVYGSKG